TEASSRQRLGGVHFRDHLDGRGIVQRARGIEVAVGDQRDAPANGGPALRTEFVVDRLAALANAGECPGGTGGSPHHVINDRERNPKCASGPLLAGVAMASHDPQRALKRKPDGAAAATAFQVPHNFPPVVIGAVNSLCCPRGGSAVVWLQWTHSRPPL